MSRELRQFDLEKRMIDFVEGIRTANQNKKDILSFDISCSIFDIRFSIEFT